MKELHIVERGRNAERTPLTLDHVTAMAGLVSTYYTTLCAAGVPAELASQLTAEWQTRFLTSGQSPLDPAARIVVTESN